MEWNKIHCGKISKKEITEYIIDISWQSLRLHLKGKTLEYKYMALEDWLKYNENSRACQVQVTNYINALKRGGLVK